MEKATNHSAVRILSHWPSTDIGRTDGHQRRYGKQGDDRLVGGLRFGLIFLAEKYPQVVVTPDALAIDKGLRRSLHAMLGLEGIGLLTGLQMVVFHRIALAFQQVPGLEAVGAEVIGHHHPVESGGFLGHGVLAGSGVISGRNLD